MKLQSDLPSVKVSDISSDLFYDRYDYWQNTKVDT